MVCGLRGPDTGRRFWYSPRVAPSSSGAGPATAGYPVQLRLAGWPVLVVGAGTLGREKAQALVDAGARVTVVAPAGTVPAGAEFCRRRFRRFDIRGKRLVIAATNDRDLNRRVAALCRRRGVWVNAVDDPPACDFFAPAVVRRGPVTLTVSTDGASPFFAGRLRRWLEAAVPESVGGAARVLAGLRRRGFRGFDGSAQLLAALAEPALRQHWATEPSPGPGAGPWIRIVGAGPGAPDLISVRGLESLMAAHVVYADQLVADAFRPRTAASTEWHVVGGRAGAPRAKSAEAIADEMTQSLALGRRVVRLHGGDPAVFGRMAEELSVLQAAGAPFEVVPGVSAAQAAAAALGVPLTERGGPAAVRIWTGHRAADAAPEGPGPTPETHVVLMSLGRLEAVVDRLQSEGVSPETPAAVVSQAGGAEMRFVTAPLHDVAAAARAARLPAPATLLVGPTVRWCQVREWVSRSQDAA